MAKSYTFEALGLLHGSMDKSFVNIIDLASQVFDQTKAFISVIESEADWQYFAAAQDGLGEAEVAGGVPLEHSMCHLVQVKGATVAIPDLLDDPRTSANPLVLQLGLRSYIGAPIHALTGKVIGALCCMSLTPRDWTAADAQILEHMARCVDDVVKSRALALEERRLRQAQQTAAAHRSTYTAHIGHEIRTPLTGIVAAVRMLEQVQDAEQSVRLMSILDRSTQRLTHFVDDVLDLSQVDAAGTDVVLEPCAPADLLTAVLEELRPAAAAKALSLNLDDRLGARAYLLDRAGLSQVLRALIDNAIKFTPAGGVTLRLHEDSYGQVVIDVIDTGIGIAAAYHDRIFEEFEQAAANGVRTHGGTGLGMTIVKRLVDRMDGTITLKSHPGQGATFTVALPLAPVPAPAAIPPVVA